MSCLGNDLTTLLTAETYESISLIHMIIRYYVSSVPRATKGKSLSLIECFSIILTPMCFAVIVPLEPLGG